MPRTAVSETTPSPPSRVSPCSAGYDVVNQSAYQSCRSCVAQRRPRSSPHAPDRHGAHDRSGCERRAREHERQTGAGNELLSRARHQRPEDPDADHATGLARGVQHPRGDAGPLLGCVGEHRDRHRRNGERRADPRGQQWTGDDAIRRRCIDAGECDAATGGEDLPDDHRRLRPKAGRQPSRDEIGDGDQRRHREEGEPGRERRISFHRLEEQTQDEHQAVEGEVDCKAGEAGRADGGRAKERQRQHGIASARFEPQERAAGNHKARQAGEHERMAPAQRSALDAGEGDAAEREHGKDLPDKVERAIRRPRPRRRIGERQPDPEETEREIEKEDDRPAPPVHDDATHDRTGRDREPGDARPDADRASARGRLRKRDVQQRERRRHAKCRPQTLYDPASDQHADARRQPADQRRSGEEGEPEDVDPLGAQAIAKGAGGQQQAREHERVAVHHPLQAGHVGGEGDLDPVERDVDDGHIERDERKSEAGGDQGRAGRGGGLGGGRMHEGKGSVACGLMVGNCW